MNHCNRFDESDAMASRSLIADDSRASRLLVSHFLADIGFESVAVADGIAAWTEISLRSLDLLVTDIEMPERSGLELLLKIRGHSDRDVSNIPVIVISSIEDPALIETVADFGANATINKPLNKVAFQRQVQDVMARPRTKSNPVNVTRSGEKISPALRRLCDHARNSVATDGSG